MTALTSLLFFIAAIAPLIVIHELGHYLVARWCGVHSEVFSVGFGRPLVSRTDRHGTRWQVALLPLGGYVRFAGDENAASVPGAGSGARGSFHAASVGRRALIVAAGPVANFLLATLMLAALFATIGEPRVAPVIGSVGANSPAAAAGVRVGDRIVAFDGQSIAGFDDLALLVQARAGQPTPLVVERAGARLPLTVTPARVRIRDLTGAWVTTGQIAVGPAKIERVRVPLAELPAAAIRFTAHSVRTMAVALGQIVTGGRGVDQLGGPVKLARASSVIATSGAVSFLFFMAMVSINLGFINLLPVPVLDGGQLVFLGVEALRRRPLSVRAQQWAIRSGLLVLLAFMVFVTANDLGLPGLLGRYGLIG